MDFFIPLWLIVAAIGTIGIGIVPLFWALYFIKKRMDQ